MKSERLAIYVFLLGSTIFVALLSEFPAVVLMVFAALAYNVHAAFAGKRFIIAGFSSGEEFAKSRGSLTEYRKSVVKWCILVAVFIDVFVIFNYHG